MDRCSSREDVARRLLTDGRRVRVSLRGLTPGILSIPPGRGVVYVYRPGRLAGASAALQVQVNGTTAGGTSPGTFFRWALKPGTYAFFTQSPEATATVQVNVEEGQLYTIELNARIGIFAGRVSMSQKDVSVGKKQVQGMKLLVSAYLPDQARRASVLDGDARHRLHRRWLPTVRRRVICPWCPTTQPSRSRPWEGVSRAKTSSNTAGGPSDGASTDRWREISWLVQGPIA